MTDQKVVYGDSVIFSIKNGDIFYPVFCGKSCSFSFKNEIILRTGVNDGLGIKRRVRRSEWSGSGTGVTVVDNNSSRYSPFYLLQEGIRRTENEWQFELTALDGTVKTITGTAIIEGLDISADVTSFSESVVNIIGIGLPAIDESPSDPGTDENVDSDYWTTTAGTNSISGTSVDGKSLVGKIILAIAREPDNYFPITSGTPTNNEAKFDTVAGSITFSTSLPFESGERVWAMWKDA